MTTDTINNQNKFTVGKVSSTLYLGDCLHILKTVQDESVDLVVTSPPYADQRKNTYGGIHPDQYVDWFMPIADELQRVLKPTGTFILNIKEKVSEGERHIYVLKLILTMREHGWLWTEEMVWHKKNCYPGKWPNRFRDSWERLLQFNKQKKFNMYQEAVMVPMGDWAKSRLANLSDTDKRRDNSKVDSGFGKNVSKWVGREMAYPTNVLHMATETGNKNQPPDPERNYYKYCGQEFWELISGDPELYITIIQPLHVEAQKRDMDFQATYIARLNQMTKQFSDEFMTADSSGIDWDKLIKHVSQKRNTSKNDGQMKLFGIR